MSVAFRRESDDEHLEPKFETPIAPGPNLVTARGKALLDAKVVAVEAAVAAEPDAEARKLLERELRYWHTRQTTAEIAPPPPADEVGIGSSVRVVMNGAARTIGIVGGDEADPAAGLIAFHAPLARALIGGTAGERVAFNGREDAIEIVGID